jgi:hypothetical protein
VSASKKRRRRPRRRPREKKSSIFVSVERTQITMNKQIQRREMRTRSDGPRSSLCARAFVCSRRFLKRVCE